MMRASLASAARRAFGIAATVLLAVALSATFALAGAPSVAQAEPYTYTLTIFAGGQGSLDKAGVAAPSHAHVTGDGQQLTVSGLELGDRVSLTNDIATVEEGSKYYVKGVRMGGRDNNTATTRPSFAVEGDRDYVVAYGMRGQLVAYTVHFVNENGQDLSEPRTYYGNVGDKAVVACLYFDGYQPQAYNLAKTLVEDESQNVLTFEYAPVGNPAAAADSGVEIPEPGMVEPGDTTVQDVPSGDATGGAEGAAADGAAGAEGEAGGAGDAAAGGAADEAAAPEEEAIGDNENALSQPEELKDVDQIADDAVPFAQSVGGAAQSPVGMGLIAALLALAAAGVIYFALSRRRAARAADVLTVPVGPNREEEDDDAGSGRGGRYDASSMGGRGSSRFGAGSAGSRRSRGDAGSGTDESGTAR
ncbi:hypothetical protein GMI70_08105 [Eggerthellaceae bacterium zg-893]|nr:hypothetical protein [Eggerthellaceae bacterium zg-893]